jgi:hypothetical protein
MKKIIENPLKKRTKISMDMDNDFLRVLDSIASLTGVSKGTMVEALGFHGFSALINSMEVNWKSLLAKDRMDEEKKKKLKDLLRGLSEIKKDWESQIRE